MKKSPEISTHFLSLHMYCLPYYSQEWYYYFLSRMNLHKHIRITQRLQLTLQFTLAFVHSLSLGKCIMLCVHHYSNIQNIFSGLKICPLYFYLSLNPTVTTWETFVLSPLSIIFFFPECNISGNIYYVAFSLLTSFTQ